MSSKMRACKTCGQQIAKNAKRCPHCGAKNKKGNAFLFILVIVVLLIVVVSMKDDDDQRPADYPTRPTLSHEGNQTEGTKENITKPTVSPKPTQSNSNGIRAEIKEALDSYEDFFEEYCNFMEKYQKNPTDPSLLTQYVNYLSQYAETMSKFEALGQEELNDEELKYYLDVHTRIMKMLVDCMPS